MFSIFQKSVILSFASIATICISQPAMADIGYADTVLEFYDSGVGPLAGPYGGTYPDGPGFPISVSTDVVLGSDPGSTGYDDFLSLPTGSYVVVGFTDETIIDGPGDDFTLNEIGAGGESADIYISADGVSFTFLGTALDSTAFDLSTISFSLPIIAMKIVGLDAYGGSPGFDLMNVQISDGSIGPVSAVPEPEMALMLGCAVPLISLLRRKKLARN